MVNPSIAVTKRERDIKFYYRDGEDEYKKIAFIAFEKLPKIEVRTRGAFETACHVKAINRKREKRKLCHKCGYK